MHLWHPWHLRLVWALALILVIFSARYFLVPPPLLTMPIDYLPDSPFAQAAQGIAPYLYEHHRWLLLPHIACGMVAILLGLFQFVRTLRTRRPAVHRLFGRVYVGVVMLGGLTGLPLSFALLDAIPIALQPSAYPLVGGFVVLSVTWPSVTAMGFYRARQRRFDDHRAWMTRSYSLTFAAVTTRLLAFPLLLLTGDWVIAINGALLSWPLNLLVAELLIRRRVPQPVPVTA